MGDTSGNRVERFTATGGFEAAFGASGRAPGTFTVPGGVAVEPGGGLLVADTVNDRIQRFAANRGFVAAYGRLNSLGDPTSGAGDGQFNEPQGVAGAADGGFWVADTGNHRIQRLGPDGAFVGKAGGPAQGTGPGQFRAPRGVALEPDGDLVVGDTGNDRIQRRDAASGAWSVLAAGVEKPSGVAVAGDGRLLVAETDADRLLILTAGGAPAGAVAGLEAPEGVSVAADGTVLVSETGADRIARLIPAGDGYAVAERFGGGRGGAAGQLAGPAGVAADGAGVWVVDRYNSRLQRFAPPSAEPTPTVTSTPSATDAPAATGTPAATPSATPAPPAATPSLSPSPTPAPQTDPPIRIAVRRLSLRISPRRDRRLPYRLRASGRLSPARPTTCRGRVALVVRRGRRVVLRRSTPLRASCAFATTLRLPRAARGRLTVTARFTGTARIAPRSASRTTIRTGR